jgi:hypothetical protein
MFATENKRNIRSFSSILQDAVSTVDRRFNTYTLLLQGLYRSV